MLLPIDNYWLRGDPFDSPLILNIWSLLRLPDVCYPVADSLAGAEFFLPAGIIDLARPHTPLIANYCKLEILSKKKPALSGLF